MIAVFVILLFTVYLAFFFPLEPRKKPVEEKSPKYKAQMKKLWQVAQTSMRERKPFRAEKALLTILKFDEKNAAAYNRLGILYAKGQKYDEAVECFEIAQSLDNNPASIHNAGLIYLEIGAYEKAKMAFSQAIELEGDMPSRYIALAKSEEKLGNTKKAVEALENAYELDPKVSTLRQILTIYENAGDAEAVTATAARVEAQIVKETAKKQRTERAKGSAGTRAGARARGGAGSGGSAGTGAKVVRRRAGAAQRKPAGRTVMRKTTAGTGATAKAGATATAKTGVKTGTRAGAKTAPKIVKPHVGRKRI